MAGKMRAVTINDNLTIHLSLQGNYQTKCGCFATRTAPLIAGRSQFCRSCFGHDKGVKFWSAARLEMQIIHEDK